MSPKIKICGVCDPLEARRIEELGADYVGMIFYSRSPRFVDIGKAKKIAGAMSGRAKRVGVFVSESQDFIKTAAAECGLAAIQLHGGQSADFAEEIAETGCEIWRAVWLDSEAALAEAEAFPCASLIADSRSKVAVGGTGELSDWALAKKLAAKRRLVLAGGISPENAEAAIRAVQPWAVDSNSAVEISPGKKDLKKVQILIEKVRNII